ncbi:MAG: hypothetical protein R6U50_09110 [Desulfobacterales bacterium]
MKHFKNIILLVLIIGFCTWLFVYDKAAEPGPLSRFHNAFNDCETCHTPWQKVSTRTCLKCHGFEHGRLNPMIRFHTAEAHCLACHTEHRGYHADIKKMNHTVLNENLLCTACHYDPHAGLFGRECRQCHGISTWSITGYAHPPAENGLCHRCHRPPPSHFTPSFQQKMQQRITAGQSIKDCGTCHTTHLWGHLLIENLFQEGG